MSKTMNKQEIRKIMLSRRKNIPHKEELSIEIMNTLTNLDIYKKSRVIALYNSLKSEVQTKDLINKSISNKKVLLPKIIDNEMYFVEIDENTKYLKSKIGVMEPIGKIYTGKIDLIIVPGVAFDEKLNRLGFGKGYYDKFLSKNKIFKIGICFAEQIIKLPADEADVKMDVIITNKNIIKKV